MNSLHASPWNPEIGLADEEAIFLRQSVLVKYGAKQKTDYSPTSKAAGQGGGIK